jgi:hypothetical protein
MRFPDDFPAPLYDLLSSKMQGMLRRTQVLLTPSLLDNRVDRDGCIPSARVEMEALYKLRRETGLQVAESLKVDRRIEDVGVMLEAQFIIAQEKEFFELMKECYEAGIKRTLDTWDRTMKTGALR